MGHECQVRRGLSVACCKPPFMTYLYSFELRFQGLLCLLRLLSITSAITSTITICLGNSTSISNSVRIILYAQGRETGLSMAARRHLHTCCGHFVSRFLHDIAGGNSYLLTAQDGITSTARSLQLSSGLLTR